MKNSKFDKIYNMIIEDINNRDYQYSNIILTQVKNEFYKTLSLKEKLAWIMYYDYQFDFPVKGTEKGTVKELIDNMNILAKQELIDVTELYNLFGVTTLNLDDLTLKRVKTKIYKLYQTVVRIKFEEFLKDYSIIFTESELCNDWGFLNGKIGDSSVLFNIAKEQHTKLVEQNPELHKGIEQTDGHGYHIYQCSCGFKYKFNLQ